MECENITAAQKTESSNKVTLRRITLSIVVPAYNEEKNIRQAIEVIIAGLSKCNVTDYEVIVVDDGSSDSTAVILQEMALQNTHLRAFSHVVNRGKGAALITGFNQSKMELILFTDADQQIDMTALSVFLEQIEYYDVLVGCREKRMDTLSRRIISKGYNLLIRSMFGIQLKDAHCPFKLFKRSFIDSIQLVSQGFFIDTELICLAMISGCRIGELRVESSRRQSGVSSVTLRHVIGICSELLHFLRRYKKIVTVTYD